MVSEEEDCWVVRREGDVLAAELRRWLPRQAAAGGTNQLTERSCGHKIVQKKRKGECRKEDKLRAKRYAQLQWNQNNLLILTSSIPPFHVICNLQVRQKPQHGSATAAPGPYLSSN